MQKKKPSVWWFIGGFLALTLIGVAYQLFGPSPAIVISKQTTYITSPLRPDGLPDYERYLLERCREGIEREENAFALLCAAIWPPSALDEDARLIARELRLDTSAYETADQLEYSAIGQVVSDWQKLLLPTTPGEDGRETGRELRLKPAADDSLNFPTGPVEMDLLEPDSSYVRDIISRAISHAWTTEQIPPLAKWVREHQRRLDLVVAASHRPKFYAPSEILLSGPHPFGWIGSMPTSGVADAQEALEFLRLRAMWHTGEGRVDAAWTDLFALLRLTLLMEQDPTSNGKYTAASNVGAIVDATLQLLDSKCLTLEEAEQIKKDIASLPHFTTLVQPNEWERIEFLDRLLSTATVPSNMDMLPYFPLSGVQRATISYTSIDWNAALVEANKWFDREAAVLRNPNRAQQRQAIDQLQSDLAAAGKRGSLVSWAGTAISPAAKGQFVVRYLLSLYPDGSISTQNRANTQLDLLQLAAALAVYRCDAGHYPDKLDDLTPDIVASLPVDVYNALPFVYFRTSDGYLLYSLGENGRDERGSNWQIDAFEGLTPDGLDGAQVEALRERIGTDTDDDPVRMPRRGFEMPKLPAKEAGE